MVLGTDSSVSVLDRPHPESGFRQTKGAIPDEWYDPSGQSSRSLSRTHSHTPTYPPRPTFVSSLIKKELTVTVYGYSTRVLWKGVRSTWGRVVGQEDQGSDPGQDDGPTCWRGSRRNGGDLVRSGLRRGPLPPLTTVTPVVV